MGLGTLWQLPQLDPAFQKDALLPECWLSSPGYCDSRAGGVTPLGAEERATQRSKEAVPTSPAPIPFVPGRRVRNPCDGAEGSRRRIVPNYTVPDCAMSSFHDANQAVPS